MTHSSTSAATHESLEIEEVATYKSLAIGGAVTHKAMANR
jgi:hypothetical protein